MTKKTIGIVGNGAWGNALYHIIKQNQPQVRLIGRAEPVTEDIIIIAVPTKNIRELKHHDRSSLIPQKASKPIPINFLKKLSMIYIPKHIISLS